MNVKDKWFLAAILLICLLVRLSYALSRQARLDSLVLSDMRTYDLLAANLIDKGYFGIDAPWSYRPPLYPFFLSLAYRPFGHSYIIARVIQAVLASLSCLLLFFIARDICGSKAALLSAFFAAADFSLIHLSGLFLSENLYIPLSLLLIWLLLKGFKESKILTFVGAGVVGGLAALCRPTILPFLVMVGLVPILQKATAGVRVGVDRRLEPAATDLPITYSPKFKMPGIIGWAAMIIAAALTIAPWTIRNFRLHHRFVPISTNGGVMLWMGLHHGAPGGYHFPEENNPLYQIWDEVERDRVGRSESIKFVINNSGETLRLAAVKMKIFWRGYLFTWSGRQWALFGILGLGGLVISLKEWRLWLLLYIYLLTFIGPHLLIHSGDRYRWPLNPLVEIWAAFFLVFVWRKLRLKNLD